MPTSSRPPSSAIAAIRSAMGKPPVLGSTFSPNFTGCDMALLLVAGLLMAGSWWPAPLGGRLVVAVSYPGSASGDAGKRAGQQVLLVAGERVKQELADYL